jgi:hypothetical protein
VERCTKVVTNSCKVSHSRSVSANYVYVCLNCGRRSLDRLGCCELTPGWTHSCTRASVRLPSAALELDDRGLVIAVDENIILETALRSWN